MLPTIAMLHPRDALITEATVAYMNTSRGIARRAFKVTPVTRQTNIWRTYSKADFMRDEMQPRAPGTPAARAGYSLTHTQYSCLEYALDVPVPDEHKASDDLQQTDLVTAQFLREKIEIAELRRLCAVIFAQSGGFTTVQDGASWLVDTNDPIAQMRTLKRTIALLSGADPDTAVISRDAWDVLVDHVLVRNRYSPTSSANVTEGMIASLLGLNEIMVASGVRNTAAEGVAASMSFQASGAVSMFYRGTGGPMAPTAGRLFAWTPFDSGDESGNVQVRTYREEASRQDVFGVSNNVDFKITAADAGGVLHSVLS